MDKVLSKVRSKDGTPIAFERSGQGPVVILVDGATCARADGSKPELVKLLEPHFSVIIYDRRGRGDSGDTLPYALEREIEDIEALINETGGTASLYGHSSGASLAMEAAVKLGNKVKKLAMYEAPYNDDPDAQKAWREYIKNLNAALAAGKRGEAVSLFLKLVGTPDNVIEGMRQAPFWPGMEAIAPTLAYDHGGAMSKEGTVPTERASQLTMPVLVMYGEASYPFMAVTARTLRQAMPQAKLLGLKDQTHDVKPEALAPALVAFFSK